MTVDEEEIAEYFQKRIASKNDKAKYDDFYETTEECSVPGRKKDNFLNDDKCFAVARSILEGKKIH